MKDIFKDIGGFLKSEWGKRLLILLAIVVAIYFAKLQYEKLIYNGLSKSQVIKAVAKNYTLARIQSHMSEVNSNHFASKDKMTKWYDDNIPPHVEERDIKIALDSLGIDYVKHPSIMNISNEVNALSNMSNY
jgi:hypothetical protein